MSSSGTEGGEDDGGELTVYFIRHAESIWNQDKSAGGFVRLKQLV